MVNLFRPVQAEQGSLTAALLALLEHSDRDLLNGLLRRAGIPFHVEAGTDLETHLPAPGGAPGTGLLVAPHFRLAVAAQSPGEPWDPAEVGALPGTHLAITLTGQAPPDGYAISWEQLDRWLATAGEEYTPESRTGFLISQFRAFLPEMGVQYFAGFEETLLSAASDALQTVKRFAERAEQFYDRLSPGLSSLREGASLLRQTQPADLLTGYIYRDYSDPPGDAQSFLRVAFHLGEGALHLAYWLGPGSAPHQALHQRLLADAAFAEGLGRLERDPLLWLWSASEERRLPLLDWHPEGLQGVEWGQYHAAVQISLGFDDLPGENLVDRVIERVEVLLDALTPLTPGTLH